jgi:glutathione S-transferase
MLQLVVADKNYSSWSMRPWVLMHASRIAFDEINVRLDQSDTARQIAAYTPSGRVPVLIDEGFHVWDSLAIMEYLAERFPQVGIWPKELRTRALARSISAEMHSGFVALRSAMPMNIRRRHVLPAVEDVVARDIDRIAQVWQECLQEHGGPFLFGDHFCAADAMYAPVVTRFVSYAVELPDDAAAYLNAAQNHPSVASWILDAWAESHSLAHIDQIYA